MHILLTKTNDHQQKIIVTDRTRQGASLSDRGAKRPLGWKPEQSGLTRNETRELILEMIG